MTANRIFQVTETLRDRLKSALADSRVPGTVFVGPLDDPDADGAALILFLYRLAPNTTLRNSEHRVPAIDASGQSQAIVYRNALPLDLYYLVTVGSMPGAGEETFLRALGHVIQAFQTDPDLTGPAVDFETVHVTFEPLSTEEASRIWTLFPAANYRTSIAYIASPVWIDPAQVIPGAAPVVEGALLGNQKAVRSQS